MNAASISGNAEQFIRAVLIAKWEEAYSALANVPENELFRSLAVLDIDDLNRLVEHDTARLSPAKSMTIEYATTVVCEGLAYPVTNPNLDPNLFTYATDYVATVVNAQQIPLALASDLTDSLPAQAANVAPLTDLDYATAAKTLDIEVEAMQAVSMTESGAQGGFHDGRRPTLRYELHVFQSLTRVGMARLTFKGKKRRVPINTYHQTHPWLSQPTLEQGSMYHLGGRQAQDREYSLLFNAMILGPQGRRHVSEAIRASSWGRFQILGNYDVLGWPSAAAFVRDMFQSEQMQLLAFVRFIQANRLQGYLKRHDWAGFAAHYNGPGYRTNNYDVQMRDHYNALLNRKQNYPKVGAPTSLPQVPIRHQGVLR